MELLRDIASIVELLLFGGLAVTAARRLRRRRDPAALWFALTTGILAAVVAGGLLLGDSGEAPLWATKLLVGLLSLFPYCLYRFMAAFGRPSRAADRFVQVMTALVLTCTALLPSFPDAGEARPGWFSAYLVVFLLHWTAVAVLVAHHLWRAGRGQPTLVRRRMRLLSCASVALTAALLVSGTAGDDEGPAGVAVQLGAMGSAVLFFLGYAPPRALRTLWSQPETDALRRAVPGLLAAGTRADVVAAVLPGLSGVVGSRGAAVVDRDGCTLGQLGLGDDEVRAALDGREGTAPDSSTDGAPALLRFDYPFGVLLLSATAHAPFFGREERALLDAVATLVEVALERVAESERERALRERLERLNELKNEFVAVVAHDLRSPMVVLAGYADLLVTRGDRFDAEDRAEMLGTISRTVKKLARLVEDVLQVARIESGEFSYRIVPFDVLEVVRGAVRDVAGGEAARRIEIVAGEPLPPGLGDPDRHWQILTNLLANALKFSPPDAPVRVTVSAGEALQVAVEDRGAGIAAEDLDKLFLKFSRLSTNGSSSTEVGTGLGLYICKSMIEAQGGAIEVRSTPGVGSTFRYTVPRAETVA